MSKRFDMSKVRAYCDSMTDAYNEYALAADRVQLACVEFGNNDTFTGLQAEASKQLVSAGETSLIDDILGVTYSIKAAQDRVMDMFEGSVDAASNALIDEDVLDQINHDIKQYYAAFDEIGVQVESIYARLQKFSKYGSFTRPDFDSGRDAAKELCGGDGNGGFINACKLKLIDFDGDALSMLKSLDIEAMIMALTSRIADSSAVMRMFSVYQAERSQNQLYRPNVFRRTVDPWRNMPDARVMLLSDTNDSDDGYELDENLLANDWGEFDASMPSWGYFLLQFANTIYDRGVNMSIVNYHREHNLEVLQGENSPFDFRKGSYIEGQGSWTDMPYGKSGSMSENGCGVIAAANVLIAMGEELNPEKTADLIAECERGGTVFGGMLGTAPAYLEKCIGEKGYQVKASYNIHEADKIADASDVIIIGVENNSNNVMDGIHYICVTKTTDGRYELHNAYNNSTSAFTSSDGAGFNTLTEAVKAYSDNTAGGAVELIYVAGITK